MFANFLQTLAYKYAVKPVFFRFDPEQVHDFMLRVGVRLGTSRVARGLTAKMFFYAHPSLEQRILGIRFVNPVGLAAGFDKNAELTQILPSVGFGFEEIGSVTGEPCEGNAKPRLWRIPKLQSLRVYYGLKNNGCEEIVRRLSRCAFRFPLGVSIAKTNCAATVDRRAAIADYLKAYRALSAIGDYDTINISCPNAFGGQPFTDPLALEQLLRTLNARRTNKPMFIKLSPDLSRKHLRAIVQIAARHGVDGFVCGNLTKQHGFGKGGISGKPLARAASRQLAYLYKKFGRQFVYISCGGIFTADDAYDRICHGASLIQLATGMIYQGPQVIGAINKGIAKRLKRDGFTSVAQAIGSAYR